MNVHTNNEYLCEFGYSILHSILEANFTAQKYVCEKGHIDTLLKVLVIHKDDRDMCKKYCRILSIIFSSNELHSKFYKKDVLNAVRKCYKIHKNSWTIFMCLSSFVRAEDPNIKNAIKYDICTEDVFAKCDKCESDENGYCPKCCVQQKVFRCFTCDKEEVRMYCEVCWKRDHQGHRGEEFFYPTRCATKQQTPNGFEYNCLFELLFNNWRKNN